MVNMANMVNLDPLHFIFYHVTVAVYSNNDLILDRLSKDFSYYLSSDPQTPVLYTIRVYLGEIPWNILPPLNATKQTVNSITYDDQHIRYNDYYSEALSRYNYQLDQADIYSTNLDRLHEITFLLMLSRVGKKLDGEGKHKIHAFGINLGGQNIIGMMPMKGGKTTLFMNFLKYPEARIISDDTPIIDRDGNIYPFPIRVGMAQESIKQFNQIIDPSKLYQIDRKLYGKKILIPIEALGRKIAGNSKSKNNRSILLNGIRRSTNYCVVKKVSRYKMLVPIMKNMVIGVGLPLILEYFWENNFKDLLRLSSIAISRLLAGVRLIIRSENYYCYFGTNQENNIKAIVQLLPQNPEEVSAINRYFDKNEKADIIS